MNENNLNQIDNENEMKGYRNIHHSALNYVQPAIENAVTFSHDATQNLINNIMNKKNK